MRVVYIALLISSTLVMLPSTSSASDQYAIKYEDASGRALTASEGILKASTGETIYKCQTVEAKVSKSGTSVSLRNIKKPKANADIDQQIKELEEQKTK